MKIKIKLLAILLSLGILVTGCASNQTNPKDNERTVVKFIIQANNANQARLIIAGPRGPIELNDLLAKVKKSKSSVKNKKSTNEQGKQVQPFLVNFIDGSCTAEVCLPDRPCFDVVIDPVNDCPDF